MASRVQASALGAPPAGIHGQDVDAGVLLQQVDARAGPLDLAADAGGDGEPLVVGAREILDGRVHLAMRLISSAMTSSTGSRLLAWSARLPGREGEDVVARLGLRFGGDGQQVLVTLRGDVVDLQVDLVLGAPFLAQGLGGVVAAGHPVVPEHDRQLAGRMRGAHERRGNHRRGRSRRRNELPAGQLCFLHQASSFFISSVFLCGGSPPRRAP